MIDKTWEAMKRHPLLTIALFFGLQTLLTLDTRALWFSDEIRYADVYVHLRDAGKWLVLSLNGVPYPDKPPVYFWLVRLLDWITPTGEPGIFFLGAAVSGFLFLLASHLLAKTAGIGRDARLAAGLVLITNIFFIGITHYSRMDLLFGAFILSSTACFLKAWTTPGPSRLPTAGFVLAALATLTKGPLGLVFPLLSSALFLAWRGELARLKQRDVLRGALAALAILLAWVAGALITDGTAFIHNIFYKQIYQRAVESFHHKEPLQYYFIALPLAWLPWTLILAAVPVGRIFKKSFWSALWAKRRQADGRAFLWIFLTGGFILLSSLSIKVLIYILPLFSPLAILCGDRLLSLDPARHRRFTIAFASLMFLLALGTPFIEFFLPTDVDIKGVWLTSLILGGLGLYLLKTATPSPRKTLLATALAMTVWIQPVAWITAPSFDPMMSPREQALVLKEYADKGYFPIAHKVYSGLYSYYAGRDILEIKEYDAVKAELAKHPKAILAVKKKYWDAWEDRPENMTKVHEQFIADQPYYLMVREAAPEALAEPQTQTNATQPSGGE